MIKFLNPYNNPPWKLNQPTDKETRDGVLEVNQARQMVNAILFGFILVVDLDENNTLFSVERP